MKRTGFRGTGNDIFTRDPSFVRPAAGVGAACPAMRTTCTRLEPKASHDEVLINCSMMVGIVCQTSGFPPVESQKRPMMGKLVCLAIWRQIDAYVDVVIEDANDLLVRGGFLRQVRLCVVSIFDVILMRFRLTLESFIFFPLACASKKN